MFFFWSKKQLSRNAWLLGVNRNYLTVQAQGGTNKFGFELV